MKADWLWDWRQAVDLVMLFFLNRLHETVVSEIAAFQENVLLKKSTLQVVNHWVSDRLITSCLFGDTCG